MSASAESAEKCDDGATSRSVEEEEVPVHTRVSQSKTTEKEDVSSSIDNGAELGSGGQRERTCSRADDDVGGGIITAIDDNPKEQPDDTTVQQTVGTTCTVESTDDGGIGQVEEKKDVKKTEETKNTSQNADQSSSKEEEKKPLSKNQMKKRRRYEKALEIKKRRKMQEKEAKRAKALAEGRDLDEERRLQEERTKSGEGRKRREAIWNERMKTAETSFGVCIDCSYEDEMTPKEINSLALQIRYSYAANKRSRNPCHLSVSSLSGMTRQHLSKVAGFPDQWRSRAFDCSEKSLVEMHPDVTKLVFLTGDSKNTLDHLDDSKTYIIGGIVDRNRLTRAALTRAESLGIETAKLPIEEHLKLVTTKVLTCNHVFEILLKYLERGNDWKKALLEVLPQRKDVQEIDGGGGVGVGVGVGGGAVTSETIQEDDDSKSSTTEGHSCDKVDSGGQGCLKSAEGQ